jgi:DNA polymerase-3 subunit gamma/tau
MAPTAGQVAVAAMPLSVPSTAPAIDSFAALVALAGERRDVQLKSALERDIRPVRIEPGLVEFGLVAGASPDIVQRLGRRLQEWTGQRWTVALAREATTSTLRERAAENAASEKARRADEMRTIPLVRALLDAFPGAEVLPERVSPEEADTPADVPDDDGTGLEPDYTDDDL